MTDQPHARPDRDDLEREFRMSRAALLRGTAGAMLAASPLLAAACGGGSSSSASSAGSSAGTPVKGGTLRAGFVGGGTAETLNPLIGVTPIDQGRIQNLYDPLVIVNPDLSTAPGLALEWNTNSDATEYEVKLRPDVIFHNGKSFGADDVIYSIQQMAKPHQLRRAVRLDDRPQGPQEGQRPHRQDPADRARRRPGRQLHLLQHLDHPERRDQLQEPDRHRPVHVRVLHARPAERVQEEPELLGDRASRTWTSSRSSRSTTPPPA